MTWKRRIGGRTGITASLPKGCYSDDSQLRLATSRAIRADGFDVEAFAKVELPIWLSYALGGGRSTTAAAEHLAKTRSPWFANTFKGWNASGGNGAAMRVQPHVWAARTPDNPDSFLPAVVRNSICTHSHATGLMGAVLHALCVARALGVCRIGRTGVGEGEQGCWGRRNNNLGNKPSWGSAWRQIWDRIRAANDSQRSVHGRRLSRA